VFVEVISETDRVFPIETGQAKAGSIHVDGPKKSLETQIVNAIEP
jgi:hypothetical protein